MFRLCSYIKQIDRAAGRSARGRRRRLRRDRFVAAFVLAAAVRSGAGDGGAADQKRRDAGAMAYLLFRVMALAP
jgi:hypothetical protein